MKKLYYILPILLIAFAFQACKTSEEAVDLKEAVSEAAAEGTDIATEEVPVATDDSDTTTERTLFASIKRTPCFGMCPTYEMKIYSDGFIEYEGTRHVDVIGTYTTNITESKKNAIAKQAGDIKFFEMEDEYNDEMVMDLPTTIVTVVDEAGKTKSVLCRYHYPKRMNTLIALFDDLIKSERWVSESGEIYPPER